MVLKYGRSAKVKDSLKLQSTLEMLLLLELPIGYVRTVGMLPEEHIGISPVAYDQAK